MHILPNIETERLWIRLPDLDEGEMMASFMSRNQSHLQPFEPKMADEIFRASYWNERILCMHDDGVHDRAYAFNLYDKKTNTLIGMIGLSHVIRGVFQSCFVGFKMDQSWQNQGLMSEGLNAIVEYSWHTLNLHRLSANHMPHNLASARVLAKCGFRKEGVAKDYLFINGKWETHVLTSLIHAHWQEPS